MLIEGCEVGEPTDGTTDQVVPINQRSIEKRKTLSKVNFSFLLTLERAIQRFDLGVILPE